MLMRRENMGENGAIKPSLNPLHIYKEKITKYNKEYSDSDSCKDTSPIVSSRSV